MSLFPSVWIRKFRLDGLFSDFLHGWQVNIKISIIYGEHQPFNETKRGIRWKPLIRLPMFFPIASSIWEDQNRSGGFRCLWIANLNISNKIIYNFLQFFFILFFPQFFFVILWIFLQEWNHILNITKDYIISYGFVSKEIEIMNKMFKFKLPLHPKMVECLQNNAKKVAKCLSRLNFDRFI
jgi:hypothetical protein